MCALLTKEKVKITALHRPGGETNLRALFDCMIGRVGFAECRLIQEPGKRPYITGSQREYYDAATKKTRFKLLVKFPDDWKQAIFEAAYEAYNAPEGAFRTTTAFHDEVRAKAGLGGKS